MADDPVRRRTRRAAKRAERQRRKATRSRKAAQADLRHRLHANSVGRDSPTCRLPAGPMILRAAPAYASRGGPIQRCRPVRWSSMCPSRSIWRCPRNRPEHLL